MITATLPELDDSRPNTSSWLQMEKRTAGELQKLAIKNPVAMATLMFLVNRMSRSNALIISQAAIAQELSVSRRSVNTAIAVLEGHNFIETLRVAGAVSYSVNTRVAWQGVRGARFAHYHADIIALESEQTKQGDVLDNQEPLQPVPLPNQKQD